MLFILVSLYQLIAIKHLAASIWNYRGRYFRRNLLLRVDMAFYDLNDSKRRAVPWGWINRQYHHWISMIKTRYKSTQGYHGNWFGETKQTELRGNHRGCISILYLWTHALGAQNASIFAKLHAGVSPSLASLLEFACCWGIGNHDFCNVLVLDLQHLP